MNNMRVDLTDVSVLTKTLAAGRCCEEYPLQAASRGSGSCRPDSRNRSEEGMQLTWGNLNIQRNGLNMLFALVAIPNLETLWFM